jgi:hypothetical protein
VSIDAVKKAIQDPTPTLPYGQFTLKEWAVISKLGRTIGFYL